MPVRPSLVNAVRRIPYSSDRGAAGIAQVRSKRLETISPRRRKRELSSKEAFRLEEEFGPRLPSHSIRPGLFSKLCSTFARPSQLGSASSSNELYTLSCATPYYRTAGADAPHPCQARTSNPSAAAKFPRRAQTLTIFPCSAKPMHILPDQRFFGCGKPFGEKRLTPLEPPLPWRGFFCGLPRAVQPNLRLGVELAACRFSIPRRQARLCKFDGPNLAPPSLAGLFPCGLGGPSDTETNGSARRFVKGPANARARVTCL